MENRWCIKCGKDLSEVMGMYVFISKGSVGVDAHTARHSRLCIDCGSGRNQMTLAAYEAMPYRLSRAEAETY